MIDAVRIAAWLDGVLYRHPFEGASARRYASSERPAFAELDERLLAHCAIVDGQTVLDVGAGPGTFARLAAARHPGATVIAVEPSADFARPIHGVGGVAGAGGVAGVRATAEALPLADASVDLAICLSSIRHVADRARALRELRRVVRTGGRLWIVELDPAADRARIANHARGLGSRLLRLAFGPLVVRTAPTRAAIEEIAEAAGWQVASRRDDAEQPVYIVELR